jgi:EamA domain-containing membrane protein RarD
MDSAQTYILISILILLIIAVLFILFMRNKKQKTLSPLTGIAFAFIVAGIVFGDDRLIGYSLMGIGVLLAVIDMFMKLRKR